MSERFYTYNPHNGQKIAEHLYMSWDQVQTILNRAHKEQKTWGSRSLRDRLDVLSGLCAAFEKKKEELSRQISLEMGKPLAQSVAEVEKAVSLIEFVLKEAPQALQSRSGADFEVLYQPLGVIYGVMPWNFPVWQVVRFAVPALAAGNTIVLKHAESVSGVALLIADVFASVEKEIYQPLWISHEISEKIVADSRVAAVSLTGSTRAGKTIASQAGASLKKCVLELGGSDAYVILPDADMDLAIDRSFRARSLNAGQSCISAKRIFVQQNQEAEALAKLKSLIDKTVVGDPLGPKTQMGPMARVDLRDQLRTQVEKSLREGAMVYAQKDLAPELAVGAYFAPTLLHKVDENNTAFNEELFGPVYTVIPYKDEEEALRLANKSVYGLGGAVFSKDEKRARRFAEQMETGSVAINDFFRSSPEKPFGGVKESGYGRELGREGFFEFVNVKTIIQK